MKHYLLITLLLVFATATTLRAQTQEHTVYDDLPGINKIYKPAYQSSYTGWKKMLYSSHINFNEIESSYNAYIAKHKGEESAIIRYYEMWRRAVAPFVAATGEIVLPDIKKYQQRLSNLQKEYRLKLRSTQSTKSDWSFYGPKETFFLSGIKAFWGEDWPKEVMVDKNGNPKPYSSQANVYSFDIAKSNENILYCGTQTGFLSKTTDKGLTWKQLGKDYNFGAGSVEAIAIHPKNPDIVYVATGVRMHRTSDGGKTWKKLNIGAFVIRIKINPDKVDQIVAASYDGLYISNDAGETWKKMWNKTVWDIEFNPKDPSVIYALSKNSSNKHTLVVSKDGGKSFVLDESFPKKYVYSSGGLLAVTPANPDVIYATLLTKIDNEMVPVILKGEKNNGKLKWDEKKKGVPNRSHEEFSPGQGYYDLVLEVSPKDENTVFWGTYSLWKSTNGGKTFIKIGGYGGKFPIHPDIQDMQFTKNGELWVSTDGGMNYTTDLFTYPKNYFARNKGIVGSEMWGFDQGWNEDIMGGGRYHNGNTLVTDFYKGKALYIGGAEVATGWVIKGKSRHVIFGDLGKGYIIPKTAEGTIEGRFDRLGRRPNMDYAGTRRSNLVQHPNYYETIYIGSEKGVWESNDMGSTFNLLFKFPGRVRYFQISHKNPKVLYADIIGKGLYRSVDGGKSWKYKPALKKWSGEMFFVISPTDENKIYACIQNGNWPASKDRIYRSTDGGDTWSNWIGNLPKNINTKCLVIQPTSSGKDRLYLFVSTFRGIPSKVYTRVEGESEWKLFSKGFPVEMSINIALPFYRDGKIRVAGNAGIWESPMAETLFKPIINPWVEKTVYDCVKDTLYFDDHSILNHSGASWKWKITPTPKYINSNTVRNPKVVPGKPGSYDVTLTVTQNGHSYSKTIKKMVTIQPTCPSVNNCSSPASINKKDWKIIYVDSEQISGGYNYSAKNAIDDDTDTVWETEFLQKLAELPHEIQIDMGKEYLISKIKYLPRKSGSEGRVIDYELYVSKSKTDWGKAVKKGTFKDEVGLKTVTIKPTKGRYLRFRALTAKGGKYIAVVAEVYAVGCIDDANSIAYNEFLNVKAYPIPATTKLTIDLPQNNKSEKWNYAIISINGQIIKEDKFVGTGSHSFDLENITPGLYLLMLKNSSNITYRVKFLKK